MPVVLRSNAFEPNDNDLSDSAIARFMELNCLEEVAAQFISVVGLSTGTQSYRKRNGEFRIPDVGGVAGALVTFVVIPSKAPMHHVSLNDLRAPPTHCTWETSSVSFWL